MTRATMPLADEMEQQLNLSSHLAAGLFQREYRWHPTRRFRADFAWPKQRLLVEIDGGQWLRGTGHNSGTGKERDCEKDAEAALLGWVTLRFTTNMVRNGTALNYIERYLNRDRAKVAR